MLRFFAARCMWKQHTVKGNQHVVKEDGPRRKHKLLGLYMSPYDMIYFSIVLVKAGLHE